jgi:U2 small nuclear ribonucleoprotein A'
LYAINHIPSLKVLDFQRIKPAERDRADRLARSAAGAALESDVQQESIKTFVPGEALEEKPAAKFSAEEKEQIRNLLANAANLQEVQEIENAVQRGVLPPQLKKAPETNGNEDEPAAKRQKV